MKTAEKIIIGASFSLLFSLWIILSSLYFLLLNENYLIASFERHNVYTRVPKLLAESLPSDPNLTDDERLAYSLIFTNIPPKFIEKILVDNVSSVGNFIHGRRDNLIVSLPAKELGISQANLEWSMSRDADLKTRSQLEGLHGVATKILILWIIVLIGIVSLFLVYGKVTNSKKMLGGYHLLLVSGTSLTVLSAVLFIVFHQLSVELLKGIEPSQKILGLLLSTILTEVSFAWIVTGVIVVTLGIVLKLISEKYLS